MLPEDWHTGRRIWAPTGPGWALLRRDVELPEAPTSATLFVTATSCEPARQFVHRTRINGQLACVGPTRSRPGETLVDAVDVTALLHAGANTITAICHSAEDPGYQAMLVIEQADGSSLTLHTDEQWRAATRSPFADAGDCGTWAFSAPQEFVDADLLNHLLTSHDTAVWGPIAASPGYAACRPNPTRPLDVQVVTPGDSWTHGDATVFDFGRVLMGGLRVELANTPATIDIRLGEELTADGDVAPMRTGNDYRDRITTEGHASSAETWGLRCFRYAALTRPDATAHVEALALRQPGFGDHAFTSSDAQLNEIWQLAADTVANHSAAPFCDSWSRERAPYEADAHLHALSYLCLNADPTPVCHTLDFLLAQRTWPTEWPFHAAMLAAHEYQWTGDANRLRTLWPAALAALPTRWIDPTTGLVRKDFGADGSHSETDCDIVDWPASCRDGYRFGPVNTVVNTIGWRAMHDLAMAGTLAGIAAADELASTAEELRLAICRHLFDPASGLFVDGLDYDNRPLPHHAIHATLFPYALGMPGADVGDALARKITADGVQFSVYPAGFLLTRLLLDDRHQLARTLLLGDQDRSWAAMLRQDAGGTMEAWNTTDKPNSTFSHPWSATPVAAMVHGLLGIRPTTPGWLTAEVHPHLGEVAWAEATIPTPLGPLHVRAEKGAEGADLTIDAPPGMRVN